MIPSASNGSPLKGKTVLITAGPTREYLDPIRFMTNASSGMMGYALAKAAKFRGAKVVLVSGPCRITSPWGVEVVPIVSAEQMHRAVMSRCRKADVFIGAAAVGDWKFADISSKKIKKLGGALRLTLTPNPDIIADVARRRGARAGRPAVVVGFALETTRWLSNAKEKLRRKGLDLIVANRPDSLGMNESRVALIDRKGNAHRLSRMPKPKLAEEILRRVEALL